MHILLACVGTHWCLTLGDTMDCVAHEAPLSLKFSTRILECVSISYLRGRYHSDPVVDHTSLETPALAGTLFTTGATWKTPYMCMPMCNCSYFLCFNKIIR